MALPGKCAFFVQNVIEIGSVFLRDGTTNTHTQTDRQTDTNTHTHRHTDKQTPSHLYNSYDKTLARCNRVITIPTHISCKLKEKNYHNSLIMYS